VCIALIGKGGECLQTVRKSIGLQTKREISLQTNLQTAYQRGACYRMLFNFGKQKFLFIFLH
jgi:hypothetical protein